MSTAGLPSPCAGCVHVVQPAPARLAEMSPLEENQVLQRLAREEEHTANQRPAVWSSKRPTSQPFCGAWSDPRAGRFLLCRSMSGTNCRKRQCAHGSGPCTQCSGEQPAHPSNDAVVPVSLPGQIRLGLGEERSLETRQLRTGQLFQGGYEEAIDFSLVRSMPPRMVEIADDSTLDGGLSQTVLIFGGPGSGKTYMFDRVLRQYIALDVDGLRPGGLVLDPKGDVPAKIRTMLRAAGRPDDDLVFLGPPPEQEQVKDTGGRTVPRTGEPPPEPTPVNLLDVGDLISPRDLGHLLADIVISTYTDVGEWDSMLYDLTESAAVILRELDHELTIGSLVKNITTVYPGKSQDGRATLVPLFVRRCQKAKEGAESTQARSPEYDAACTSAKLLISTTEARQIRFLIKLVQGALGPATGQQWRPLSTPRSEGGAGSVLESIFADGKVVVVSIGEGDPLVRRAIMMIAKALFQIMAGTRVTKNTDHQGWQKRSVTLACDEFAQVITEREADGLSDSMFFSRSRQYKCFNLLALQSVHMGLARVGNEHLWNAVIGNANVRVFMSVNDAETAALASAIAGRRTIMSPVESWSDAQSGRNYSQGTSVLERSAVPDVVPLQGFERGDGVAIGRLDGRVPQTRYFHVLPI